MFAFTVLSTASSTALASEGPTFGGPVGGTDMRSAYLPSSGLYVSFVAGAGYANRSYGDDAKVNPHVSALGNTYVGAPGLTYVYPFKLFGGSLASSVQLPYQYGHITINGRSDYYRGVGDLYSELIAWSRYIGTFGNSGGAAEQLPPLPYGLTVKLAYSMIFPTGKYNTTQIMTPGHGVYFFIPSIAATYLTAPNFLGDGLEISARVFLDLSAQNPRTRYSTGTVGDIDFAVTERVGRWQAGVAGFYARQWEDDIHDNQIVSPNGKKLMSVGLGPVIAYDLPQWHASVKLKVGFPVGQSNTLNTTKIYLSFVKAM